MKFIQSAEKTNQLVNLEQVYSIQKMTDHILFNIHTDQIFWVGEVEKDWETITNALNSDVSSLHIIK